jgi:ribosomal protein S1
LDISNWKKIHGTLAETFPVGSIHEGTVSARTTKGALVSLPYGLEGFAPSRHLAKEDGTNIAADETNQFMVIEFDRNEKRIVLSHARIWEKAKQEEVEAERKERVVEAGKNQESREENSKQSRKSYPWRSWCACRPEEKTSGRRKRRESLITFQST